MLAAVCALPQAALAETTDCKSVADPTLRLICYDRLNPPVAAYPMPLPQPARRAPAPRAEEGIRHVGPTGDDDAQVNAMMHNICRGC